MPPPRVRAPRETLTLIDGLSFAVSALTGEFVDPSQGFICEDTRHLEAAELRVDGVEPLHLGVSTAGATEAHIHSYLTRDGHPDPAVEIVRHRRVAPRVMSDHLEIRNWSVAPLTCEISITYRADFADIFEIRRLGRPEDGDPIVVLSPGGEALLFSGSRRATEISFAPTPTRVAGGRAVWTLAIAPGAGRSLRADARAVGGSAPPLPPMGTYRARRERRGAMSVESEPRTLGDACRRSLADFSALTMRDPLDRRRRMIAAGIPWFVALFGRDSLIASYQLRAAEPGQLVSTLKSLAARQGRNSTPGNDEQPGKILHELRFTEKDWLGAGTARGMRPYYGSIDATPLFLMMLDTARRWGGARSDIASLIPAARDALGWLDRHADPDGDGFIEYAPGGDRSLTNQGWKDSEDAVQFPDGTLATGPVALVEVQAYAARARVALADTLEWLGHDADAARLRDAAAHLSRAIRDAFWVTPDEGPGYFGLALDGNKQLVDVRSSNAGHVLWAGVADPAQAAATAAGLVGDHLFSGWGLRTLADDAAGFNPLGYHIGSVWPHDTALAIEGLLAYGHTGPATTIATGLIDAMAAFDHRLPELFGGHRRVAGTAPVPYPTACRPQAWAAGVPLTLVAAFLGIEPRAEDSVVRLCPVLPDAVQRLRVDNIPMLGGFLSVTVSGEGVEVHEAPPDVLVELGGARTPT